mmetsp:Transcript_10556/g.21835  ORF Transcript_10556/g.21835 Transcript_10556/m.21835 type:complete len:96 (-) Transcript_10556:430-717(-)
MRKEEITLRGAPSFGFVCEQDLEQTWSGACYRWSFASLRSNSYRMTTPARCCPTIRGAHCFVALRLGRPLRTLLAHIASAWSLFAGFGCVPDLQP